MILIDGTLRENVAFGAREVADDKRVMWALERAQLGDWIGSLPEGLDTMVGESGKLVSGGQRRRVAIARSLYRHPQLLILDEATSDVDAATESALLDTLRSLSAQMTTVIVSHRLAPIQASNRVAMLDAGSDRGCRPISRAGGSRSRVPPTRRSVTPIPGDVACERSRHFSAPGRTLLCCVAPSTLPTTVS